MSLPVTLSLSKGLARGGYDGASLPTGCFNGVYPELAEWAQHDKRPEVLA